MFKQIANATLDMLPIQVPILQSQPTVGIPLESSFRELSVKDRVKSTMSSYGSSLILNFADFNTVYLANFPEALRSLPSTIWLDKNNPMGVYMNMDLASTAYSLEKKTITIQNINDFSVCLYYGTMKMLLYKLDDENYFNELYHCACTFLYALIMRMFMRDFDILNMSDQYLATIYLLVSKLIVNGYFVFEGNRKIPEANAVVDFFTTKEKTYKKAKVNMDDLPWEAEVTSFATLFEQMDMLGVLPDINLDMFRNRVSQYLASPVIVGLSNGLDFLSMITAAQIPSTIFSNRIVSISPTMVTKANKTLLHYMADISNRETETVYGFKPQSQQGFVYTKPEPEPYDEKGLKKDGSNKSR